MRRLHARIVAGVVLAVAAAWMIATLSAPLIGGLVVEGFERQLLGNGLGWMGEQFELATPEEWPQLLEDARQSVIAPLEIVPASGLPPDRARRAAAGQPFLTPRGSGPLLIHIPLHGGAHVLVVGPMPPPPVRSLVVFSLVFGLVLIPTVSLLVGFPLVRRLRRFRTVIHELGRGNWAARLDIRSEGALRELAESINRTAEQLERQFQEREALLQAVSHEMGTPLSRMRFQVELLESSVSTAVQRERLRALGEDLDELDELSTELVSWMDSEPRTDMRQPFELAPVLESLVELGQSGAAPPVIALSCPAGIRVAADRRQFERAIENLLRNAVRYAQERVTVTASIIDGHVAIDVGDDGPGIPWEQRTRVLNPFVRLDGSHTQAHRGLGLGLAIVRRIVEAHGGSVTISESPERGTLVRTLWPT
jgi:signal transduction histidine kinase